MLMPALTRKNDNLRRRTRTPGVFATFALFAACAGAPDYGSSELALIGRYAEAKARTCGADEYRIEKPQHPSMTLVTGYEYHRGYWLDICGERIEMPLVCSLNDDAGCRVAGMPYVDEEVGSYDAAVLYAASRSTDFWKIPFECQHRGPYALRISRTSPARVTITGCGESSSVLVRCERRRRYLECEAIPAS